MKKLIGEYNIKTKTEQIRVLKKKKTDINKKKSFSYNVYWDIQFNRCETFTDILFIHIL